MTENLKLWDGVTPAGKKMPYKPDNLMIDNNGTVYYYNNTDAKWLIWCPASRLEYHVHLINQIMSRK